MLYSVELRSPSYQEGALDDFACKSMLFFFTSQMLSKDGSKRQEITDDFPARRYAPAKGKAKEKRPN